MSHGHEIVTPTPAGFVPHKVAHHFRSHAEEFQACKLAFWLFLATEIMLFGGIFMAYFYYHQLYPETFRAGGSLLNWKLGTLNTIILLSSSWTMAMGVRAAQLSQKKQMMRFLGLTVLGALAFLVVKYIEYSAKIHAGTVPAKWYAPVGHYAEVLATVPNGHLFFNFYFTMTGIHGLHVVVGAALIVWIMIGGAKGKYHSGHFLPVDLVGIYWHLVDLIWIFLFPLLYLVP